MLFVLFGISIMTFTIMQVIPGDPARANLGPGAGPEQLERMRVKLGLDQPPHVQYIRYMERLFKGDLGDSIRTRKPVLTELKNYLPATLELLAAAMILNVSIAIPLGVLSAFRPGKIADMISRLFAAFGMGMPIFWVGLMAQVVFFRHLEWLPATGRLPPGVTPPEAVTGLYIIDALIAGDFDLMRLAMAHLCMPAIVMALPEIAVTSRLTRSSMLQVLNQDYIRAAYAKGLSSRRVVWIHGLRNAFVAPLTIVGLQVGWVLGGTLLVEGVFSWGGLGFLAFHSIYRRDFPVIMGVTLLMCAVFLISNFIVDVLYRYLDPRMVD